MQTNLVSNPEFSAEVVTTYPGVVLGRGATVDGDRIVFDNTSAPFACFLLDGPLSEGHTYTVSLLVEEGLTGSIHLQTYAGPESQAVGTITTPGTTSFTFVAVGSEGGFTATGDLHNTVARIGEPLLAE